MSCAGCDRLRAELAEATDELAEWRRQERRSARDKVSLEREVRLVRRFGLTPLEGIILNHLVERSPHVVTHEAIMALRPGHLKEDAMPKEAQVFVCKIRSKLGAALISTQWGRGYYIDHGGLDRLARMLDERIAA